MALISFLFYACLIYIIVKNVSKKKENKKNEETIVEYNPQKPGVGETYQTQENKKEKKMTSVQNTGMVKTQEEWVAVETENVLKSAQTCLLQQSSSYSRGTPFLFASNENNELFIVYFYPNTFYIVKVIYENNKFKVIYDYRNKHVTEKGLDYYINGGKMTATLKLLGINVGFFTAKKMEYNGSGCKFSCDQSQVWDSFVSYAPTYKQNLDAAGKVLEEKNTFTIEEKMNRMTKEDKEYVKELIQKGEMVSAIKEIRERTGFGLADCKTIAENMKKNMDTKECLNASTESREERNTGFEQKSYFFENQETSGKNYFEIWEYISKISKERILEIKKMIEQDHLEEAISALQRETGLDLIECKKIAENPQEYL